MIRYKITGYIVDFNPSVGYLQFPEEKSTILNLSLLAEDHDLFVFTGKGNEPLDLNYLDTLAKCQAIINVCAKTYSEFEAMLKTHTLCIWFSDHHHNKYMREPIGYELEKR